MTNVRAFVVGISDFDPTSNKAKVGVSYIEIGAGIVETTEVWADFSSAPTDLSEWVAIIATSIIDYATGQSYSLQEKDILWATPNFLNQPQALATDGIKSAIINGKTVANTTIFTNTSGMDFLFQH